MKIDKEAKEIQNVEQEVREHREKIAEMIGKIDNVWILNEIKRFISNITR